MSIIQDIRDKYARISVIAIALALIGFILTDYFSGKNRGGGTGRSNSIGSVNGHRIGIEEFAKNVEQTEAGLKKQGYPEAMAKQQALEQTWSQQVNRILLSEEFDKLRMRIGKRERGDILFGPNAPEDIKRLGTDEKTGQYDPMRAKQNLDQLMKEKDQRRFSQAQKDQLNDYINQLELQRKSQKYDALFSNSANFARWFVEKQTADNSLLGKISMVKVFYADSAFVDSTIKISDKEIEDYLGKHKEDYKQEESRSINYVNISGAPSAADSADIKKIAFGLKEAFDTTDNIEQLLASEGVNSYYNGYISGKNIQTPVKDSIFKIPIGSIYGPYLEGGNYTLAKLEGIRQMPDTVKIRHILIATMQRDQQSGQFYEVRDSATAYKLADSIRTAISTGSNFDSLCVKFSEDQGSKDKGGVYEKVPSGQMTGLFNDFIFLNPAGSKGIVKTEFGYHYIEVLSQKGSSVAYKIAYLPKEIVASQETDAQALQEATNFAGDSRDQKSFDTAFEKTLKPKGINKGIGTNIKRNDAQVQGLEPSRTFVRNIYSAKLGEVLKPEPINNRNYKDYVVAIVTEVLKEGTQSAAQARPYIEPVLRNRKKAEMLKQKAGKITTLEAAAVALGKPIEPVDSLRMKTGNPNARFGYEPKVNGATFNPANKGKLVPEALEGINGVYVIRVENISATSAATGSVDQQRKEKYQQAKQSGNNLIEALKKAASIKDKRSDTY